MLYSILPTIPSFKRHPSTPVRLPYSTDSVQFSSHYIADEEECTAVKKGIIEALWKNISRPRILAELPQGKNAVYRYYHDLYDETETNSPGTTYNRPTKLLLWALQKDVIPYPQHQRWGFENTNFDELDQQIIEGFMRGITRDELINELRITQFKIKDRIGFLLEELDIDSPEHITTIAVTKGWIDPKSLSPVGTKDESIIQKYKDATPPQYMWKVLRRNTNVAPSDLPD